MHHHPPPATHRSACHKWVSVAWHGSHVLVKNVSLDLSLRNQLAFNGVSLIIVRGRGPFFFLSPRDAYHIYLHFTTCTAIICNKVAEWWVADTYRDSDVEGMMEWRKCESIWINLPLDCAIRTGIPSVSVAWDVHSIVFSHIMCHQVSIKLRNSPKLIRDSRNGMQRWGRRNLPARRGIKELWLPRGRVE